MMRPPGGPPQMRRGTSRVVPVVVSAGLAVGVFCGLLFGLGTGKEEASAATSNKTVGEKNKDNHTVDVEPPPSETSQAPLPKAPPTKPPAPAPTVASGGSAAPEPAAKTVKLRVVLKPDSAAMLAKVTVDGKDAPEGKLDIDLGDAPKKEVRVAIKAQGFKDLDQKVEIEAGKDTELQLELVRKRVAAPLPPRPEPQGGKKPPPSKKPGNGLIDI